MAKTSKSKTGRFRITIPPPIMTVFNLEDGVEYDWISAQGYCARVKTGPK